MTDNWAKRMQFAPGEVIFSEGDPSDTCFQVFSGRVEIVLDRNGERKVVAEIEPGDVFGEMGIIDEGPRSATAIATSDTVCVAYSSANFLEQLESDPKTMATIVRTLITRLRLANRTIASSDPDKPLLERLFGRLKS